MASYSSFLISLFLFMPTLLAMSANPHPHCDNPCKTETTLQLYLHQFVAGANHPNRNEDYVIFTSYPLGFGQTLVHDWILTPTTNPGDTLIARAQGLHIQVGRIVASSGYISLNIVFTSGRFTGSTLQVMGVLTAKINGQWSIIGGTGEFTMARGIINYIMDPASNADDGILKLDIHINTPRVPQTGSAAAAVADLLDIWMRLASVAAVREPGMTRVCAH